MKRKLKVSGGQRRGILKLGYEEWRKRQIERMVIFSGYREEDKIAMLKEIRGSGG